MTRLWFDLHGNPIKPHESYRTFKGVDRTANDVAPVDGGTPVTRITVTDTNYGNADPVVTKKRGRPAGTDSLSAAEKMRRYRERKKAIQ